MRGAALRKTSAFLLVESRSGARQKRIDWTLVLLWAAIALTLWILLAVR
jgi:hypothetical protein